MADIKPPTDFDRTQRKLFRTLVQSLAEQGIEPSSRAMMLEELVRIDSRIALLRASEKDADPASKMAVTRALNVATAERRRLHDTVFKRARRIEPQQAPIATASAKIAAAPTNEADEAWRDRFHNERQRPNRRPPLEPAELERRYGEPSWAALLYPTIEAQARGERALESYWSERPAKKQRLDQRRAAD